MAKARHNFIFIPSRETNRLPISRTTWVIESWKWEVMKQKPPPPYAAAGVAGAVGREYQQSIFCFPFHMFTTPHSMIMRGEFMIKGREEKPKWLKMKRNKGGCLTSSLGVGAWGVFGWEACQTLSQWYNFMRESIRGIKGVRTTLYKSMLYTHWNKALNLFR